ncbi:prephenate dehydrogenase/arogenate dehydrogenase family protein, partial [Marinospirillum sp.]|uniref:prephenate dehydrogenase/arogenate dehydrogenase family protein n=1 Tax=Marinospirillum sp. TaxID=2183934 RepID=UPI00286FFB49
MAEIKNFLVVGLGLIGGSVALAARKAGFAERYLGVDLAQDERQGALTLGVVDEVSEHLEDLAPQADLIVLAVPVLAMEPVLQALKPHLKADAILTDVGSCKAVIAEAAERVFGRQPANFILG